MKLFFDTETTGVVNWGLGYEDSRQPLPVSICMIVTDDELNIKDKFYQLIKVDRSSEEGAFFHHKISREMTDQSGIPMTEAFDSFVAKYFCCDEVIGHNVKFDLAIMNVLATKLAQRPITGKPSFCTMLESTNVCKIPKANGKGRKWPKLAEAYKILCGKELVGAHNALVDVKACIEVYKALKNGPQSSGEKPTQYQTETQGRFV